MVNPLKSCTGVIVNILPADICEFIFKPDALYSKLSPSTSLPSSSIDILPSS